MNWGPAVRLELFTRPDGLRPGRGQRHIQLFSLAPGKRQIQPWLRANLIMCWKVFHGHSCVSPADLFQQPPQNRTRGHCYKIFPPATNTDIRKRFFTIRCIPVWNSLSSDTVWACSSALNRIRLRHRWWRSGGGQRWNDR